VKLFKIYANRRQRDYGIPTPAKRLIPDWYKNAESYFTDSSGKQQNGLKKCMPYTDAMVSGYMLRLPANVFIDRTEAGDLSVAWEKSDVFPSLIAERPKELGATMPRPPGFAPNHLVFSGTWAWKTPKGWSTLVTHPLNRADLPFYTASAIMDSDAYSSGGNIPFFIKEDFVGVIPEGTPIAQIIPIKRASWKVLFDPGMEDLIERQAVMVRSDETPYKKIAWYRKKYD
jgi:hypothetical protein